MVLNLNKKLHNVHTNLLGPCILNQQLFLIWYIFLNVQLYYFEIADVVAGCLTGYILDFNVRNLLSD